jgi:hypothetical protein
MWIRPRPAAIAGTTVLFGALAVAGGIATAAPSPAPAPGPASTSSSDEIADMVMDAIQRPAGPTTPAVPAPPAGQLSGSST